MKIQAGKHKIDTDKIFSYGFYDDRAEITYHNHDTKRLSYDDFSIFVTVLTHEIKRLES